MIKIRLLDQSFKEFTSQPTILEVAKSISPHLMKDTLGGIVNKERLCDLRDHLSDGDELEILTYKNTRSSAVYLHSAAHILAQAVQEVFSETQITIGPVIKDGFYYDFCTKRPFTQDDLIKIEERMQKIVSEDISITKEVMSVEEAISLFTDMGEHFKVEIIKDLEKQEGLKNVSIYHQGDWLDLCRGPHIQRTGQLKAFKLLSVAAAYFRGDETRQQLQRIYGTAWPDKKQLNTYLQKREEIKQRDHRQIGKQQGLFYFHPSAPGSPFFTNKGCIIYRQLIEYLQQLYRKYGYQEVITPEIFNTKIYETSGHYEHFLDNMFFVDHLKQGVLDKNYAIKPMNCPGHCLLFKMEKHSYKDLPLRIADFGRLHRWERSGVLHGLLRVRSMCQDDAHIFCTPDQIRSEVKLFMNFLNEVYTALGLEEKVIKIATRPKQRVGSDDLWDRSERDLQQALEELNFDYHLAIGEGAFYGPKIEMHVIDAIERSWQLGTIQLDYSMPDRFQLKYVGHDNEEHMPVMLHRAILGTLERFIGVYLEHTKGRLPTWLSPCQVRILNISNHQDAYCQNLKNELKKSINDIRVEYDDRNEKLGYKIRNAQIDKVPYIVIVGQKEAEENQVSIRSYGNVQKNAISKEEFFNMIISDIENKSVVPLFLKDKKE